MQDQIEAAHDQLYKLWVQSVAKLGGASPLTALLGRVAMDMRDAKVMAQYPGLKQVHCIVTHEGWIHAAANNTTSLCGAEIDLTERIYNRTCAPTCERCIEKLVNK